jgi:hypothetical protein
MTATKENRTLAILNAATAGNYGVMAAIAYGTPFQSTKRNTDNSATTSNT